MTETLADLFFGDTKDEVFTRFPHALNPEQPESTDHASALLRRIVHPELQHIVKTVEEGIAASEDIVGYDAGLNNRSVLYEGGFWGRAGYGILAALITTAHPTYELTSSTLGQINFRKIF